MNNIFKFRRKYLLIAILIFVIEILIAIYAHDRFIRPYFGDFLVVILIYCLIKSFVNRSVLSISIFVLLFSYTIEFLQYLNIVQVLGIQNNTLAKIIIGTSFAWSDIIAYTAGIILVILVEKISASRKIM